MSKKISVGVALALVIASVAATFAITMAVSQKVYNRLINDISGKAVMYSSIDEVKALISTNYYYFNLINEENINHSLTSGYIDGLGDPDSRLMSAADYSTYKNRLNGNASGVGITTAWDKGRSALIVTSVANGSSAATKGIKENDVITKIAGESVSSSNYERLLNSLSGDTLSTISITCLRNGTMLEFNVTVGYSFVSVSMKKIGSIGVIRISAFYANTQEQLKECISSLQNEGVSAIVFDLRDTAEGTVEYAAAALDCITPICSNQNEVLAKLIGRNDVVLQSYPSTSNNLNLPMAVLVNRGTAGSAELFACDLRAFDKAFLVGVFTAGKGTAQQAFTLEDGSAVLLTTSKIIPYKSESFQDTGLEPDYTVEYTADAAAMQLLDESKDPQLQKAIAVLSEKK